MSLSICNSVSLSSAYVRVLTPNMDDVEGVFTIPYSVVLAVGNAVDESWGLRVDLLQVGLGIGIRLFR